MSRFKKLVSKLRERGYSEKYATKVAAKIGDEKYGTRKMSSMSVASRKKRRK